MPHFLETSIQFDAENGIPAGDNSLEFIRVCNPFDSENSDPAFMIEEVARVLVVGGIATFDLWGESQEEYITWALGKAFELKATGELNNATTDTFLTLMKSNDVEKEELSYSTASWNSKEIVKSAHEDKMGELKVSHLYPHLPKAYIAAVQSKQHKGIDSLDIAKSLLFKNGYDINVHAVSHILRSDVINKSIKDKNVAKAIERELKIYRNEFEKSIATKNTFEFETSVSLFKKAVEGKEDERIVYYSVHTPNQRDMDNHYFPKSTLEEACSFYENFKNMDTDHDFNCYSDDEVEIIENYIAKGDEELLDREGNVHTPKAGQWIIGVYCKSDYVWERVKDGTFSGVSMYGQGLFVPGDEEELINE